MDPNIVLNWERRILASNLSIRATSAKIGKGPTYLGGLFSSARLRPEKVPEPGVLTMMNLARELNTTLEELMTLSPSVEVIPPDGYNSELDKQSGKVMTDLMNRVNRRMAAIDKRPSVEDVIGWWRANNGKLTGCAQIEEAFDLIEVPHSDSPTVRPHKVGAMSLAAEALHGPYVDRLTHLVQTLPREEQEAMATSYRRASISKIPLFSEPLKIDIHSANNQFEQTIEYIRVLLPIETLSGRPFVLNYCFRISAS